MTTLREVNKLGNQLLGGSEFSLSLSDGSKAVVSRNTLSKLMSDIKAPTKSWSCDNSCTSNNNNNSNSAQSSQVKEYDDLMSKISFKTQQTALKIVNMVRFLSSPLRLIIKLNANFKGTMEERIQYIQGIKICDDVKCNMVGGWDDTDTFGLRVLVKMARFKEKLTGLINNHAEYVKCFQPGVDINPFYREIAFYLYRVVMGTPLPVLAETFMKRVKEIKNDENTSDFAADAENDLRNKIAFELNNYAVVVLQKRLRMKVHNQELTYHPQHLLDQIYQTLAASNNASARGLAQQMTTWFSDDSDVAQFGGRGIKSRIMKNKDNKTNPRQIKRRL